MFRLRSITTFFATHGNLRKSQRTTLAALVWALIRPPLLSRTIQFGSPALLLKGG